MCSPVVAGFVVESIIAGAECIPAGVGFAVASKCPFQSVAGSVGEYSATSSKCPVEFAGSVGEYFVVASKCPIESVARSVGEFNCSCKCISSADCSPSIYGGAGEPSGCGLL